MAQKPSLFIFSVTKLDAMGDFKPFKKVKLYRVSEWAAEYYVYSKYTHYLHRVELKNAIHHGDTSNPDHHLYARK